MEDAAGSAGGGWQGMRVRFRGVRGSFPAPGAATTVYGGNTSCVEVRAGGRLVILDGGTGLIHLGEELAGTGPEMTVAPTPDTPLTLTFFFSHAHTDHIFGFPFFKPAYQSPNTFHLFGPAYVQSFQSILESTLRDPYFPAFAEMRARRHFQDMGTGDAVVWDGEVPLYVPADRARALPPPAEDRRLRVVAYRNPGHPTGGVLNYRVHWRGRSFVYATDTEGRHGGDPEFAHFARGADLLVHDSQYFDEEYDHPERPTRGWGHSTWTMAIDAARLARAERLVLFHHDPFRDDAGVAAMEAAARKAFPWVMAAREGMEIEV